MDAFYRKRARKLTPWPTLMHHDLQSWLATLAEVALVIWLPSQDQRGRNPRLRARRQPQRTQCHWSGHPTNRWNWDHSPTSTNCYWSLSWPLTMLWHDGWSMPQFSMPSPWSWWCIPQTAHKDAPSHEVTSTTSLVYQPTTTPLQHTRGMGQAKVQLTQP